MVAIPIVLVLLVPGCSLTTSSNTNPTVNVTQGTVKGVTFWPGNTTSPGVTIDYTDNTTTEFTYVEDQKMFVIKDQYSTKPMGDFGQPSISQARYQVCFLHPSNTGILNEIIFTDNFTYYDNTHIQIKSYWKATVGSGFSSTKLNPQDRWEFYYSWKILPISTKEKIWYKEPLSGNGSVTVLFPSFGASVHDDLTNINIVGNPTFSFIRER